MKKVASRHRKAEKPKPYLTLPTKGIFFYKEDKPQNIEVEIRGIEPNEKKQLFSNIVDRIRVTFHIQNVIWFPYKDFGYAYLFIKSETDGMLAFSNGTCDESATTGEDGGVHRFWFTPCPPEETKRIMYQVGLLERKRDTISQVRKILREI